MRPLLLAALFLSLAGPALAQWKFEALTSRKGAKAVFLSLRSTTDGESRLNILCSENGTPAIRMLFPKWQFSGRPKISWKFDNNEPIELRMEAGKDPGSLISVFMGWPYRAGTWDYASEMKPWMDRLLAHKSLSVFVDESEWKPVKMLGQFTLVGLNAHLPDWEKVCPLVRKKL